jgi:predicted DNA-binding transcriptional regulator AlpA
MLCCAVAAVVAALCVGATWAKLYFQKKKSQKQGSELRNIRLNAILRNTAKSKELIYIKYIDGTAPTGRSVGRIYQVRGTQGH